MAYPRTRWREQNNGCEMALSGTGIVLTVFYDECWRGKISHNGSYITSLGPFETKKKAKNCILSTIMLRLKENIQVIDKQIMYDLSEK